MSPLEPTPDTPADVIRDWVAASDSVAVLSGAPWLADALGRPVKQVQVLPRRAVDVVIALDPDWDLAQLDETLAGFARLKKKGARLVLGFQNVASAGALLELLEGHPARRGWSASDVASRAATHGLTVVARRGFSTQADLALAAPTRAALATLFGQLNPDASDDWVLLHLTAGRRTKRAFQAGLVSVVMRNHSLSRLGMLDQAIFSLAGQSYRPLEIILVSQAQDATAKERLEALLKRHQPVGGYSFRVVLRPSAVDIRAKLVNIGLAEARGQYVAFLDDDDVIYPQHYVRLVQALRDTEFAWAFTPVRRAFLTQGADGNLFCLRKDNFPRSGSLDLPRLMHDNYVTCHSYLIDRQRLGRFALGFEETLTKGEDYTMLLRLLALFRPAALGGAPSAEYRIRDDGSNTIVHDNPDQTYRARLQAEWERAIEHKNRLTAGLQVLITKSEFVAETRRGIMDDEPSEGPEELRYRLADLANTMLKRGLPFVHSRAKAALDPRIDSAHGR